MNKMNKKGFTLIEMLVVIAIIAVLVSIIIPTVTSATDKAAAATNAANLRSLVAEATTKYLTNDQTDTGNLKVEVTPATGTATAPTVTVTVKTTVAPKSKKVGSCAADKDAALVWDNTNGKFIAHYDGFTLDQFQKVAAGETAPKDLTTPGYTGT